MAKSEYAGVFWELKEQQGRKPWLLAAFDEPGLSCIGDSDLFGLQFRDGVTFQEAEAFRSHLHKMVKGISYTQL